MAGEKKLIEPLGRDQMKWWLDARFGMFLHWGLYSIAGRGEWMMFAEQMDTGDYAEYAGEFDARDYEPKAWAAAAKAAGMKYMVLTARHHDGFALWDSKASEFNSVNSAAGRDIVAEYVEACRGAGLKVGLYYSPMDWRFPGYWFPKMYRRSAEAMKDQCWQQVRELMSNYGRIDILWYDGGWMSMGGLEWKGGWRSPVPRTSDPDAAPFWESEKLNAMARELQPGIIISPRSGWAGDFDIRERKIGGLDNERPWESCDCLAQSWGYKPDKPMMSLRQVIAMLVHVVGRGGNLLLNVAPTAGGAIEQRQIRRLEQVGRWLEEYGETIYGTLGGPWQPGEWGASTRKGKKAYVHILEWCEDVLRLDAVDAKLVRAEALNGSGVKVEQSREGITVEVPEELRQRDNLIVELEFDAEPEVAAGG